MQSLTNIDGHQPDAIRVAHDVNQAMFDVLTQPLAFHLVVRGDAGGPASIPPGSVTPRYTPRSKHAGGAARRCICSI